MKVLLTGGGTAGHINPALAIAEIVKQNAPGSEIAFVGIRGGREDDLVPREGYPLHYVKSMGIKRSLSLSNIKALFLAVYSPYAKQTTEILDRFQPDIVIGTGGYACWPIMAAAVRRGIPTALHESNALPGLAVRRLQKKVDRIWINFEHTANRLSVSKNVVCVGNPLRSGFGLCEKAQARARLGIQTDEFFVLSFGGSGGAEEMNKAAVELMHRFGTRKGYRHLHAAGARDYANTQSLFEAAGLSEFENCVVKDYIYDMPLQMAAADLVISRAGAMTLSELARMGKTAILVPSPNVTDNHQFINAKTLSDANAAILVEESELSGGALTDAVEKLLDGRIVAAELEKNICSFADRDANRLIWQEITELLKTK